MKQLLLKHVSGIINLCFTVLLLTYVPLLIIETFKSGFVSSYLNLNAYVYTIAVFGFLSVFIITKKS